MFKFFSVLWVLVFMSAGVAFSAPIVDERPMLSDTQLVSKKEKARNLLSKQEIHFRGQYSRTVLRPTQGVYFNFTSWDVCYKGNLKADFSINEYGNVEVFVHRREDVAGCAGMKLVIDPETMTMSYYDYDYQSRTYSGPFSRVIELVK